MRDLGEQIKPVNLISDEQPWLGMDPKYVRAAIMACRSKEPVRFRDYLLGEERAYLKPPICNKIKWRITRFDLAEDKKIKELLDETKGDSWTV